MIDQITGEYVGDTIDDPQDDRLQAVPTVRPLDFVNARFDQLATQEYIRMFVDTDLHQLRLYRRVAGDPGEGDFVRTIIGRTPGQPDLDDVETVRIETNHVVDGEPEAYNLHYRSAQNVLTWLALLAKERSPVECLKFEYWGETGKEALSGTGVGEESLSFLYRTESGRVFQTEVVDCYTARSTMMARHPK